MDLDETLKDLSLWRVHAWRARKNKQLERFPIEVYLESKTTDLVQMQKKRKKFHSHSKTGHVCDKDFWQRQQMNFFSHIV